MLNNALLLTGAESSPNPLTAYEEALVQVGLVVEVVALSPSLGEIEHRLESRGRPGDLDRRDERRREAERQLRLLDAEPMRSMIIDSTGLSVDQTVELCLERLTRLA